MRSFEEIVEDLDRDGFGHYLAGFIDGEGSFVIARAKQTYTCRFQMKLRDDDAAILFELQARTGIGTVKPEKVYARGERDMRNTRPQMTWVVCSKSECALLVRLLERYPLRAKKANDFAIWRLAVRESLSKSRRGSWETMAALRNRLVESRRYAEQPLMVATVAGHPPLGEIFNGAAA